MSTDTVINVIANAYRYVGIVPENQPVPNSLLAQGVSIINDIIDDWGANRIYIPYTSLLTLPLTQGVETYTIGPSASYTLNSNQLMEILELNINDPSSNGVDFPCIPIDEYQYANIPYKLSQGIPISYLLRLKNGFTQIFFQPLPWHSGMTAKILAKQALSRVSLNDTLTEIPEAMMSALKAEISFSAAAFSGKEVGAQIKEKLERRIKRFLAVNAPIDVSVKKDETINYKYGVYYSGYL